MEGSIPTVLERPNQEKDERLCEVFLKVLCWIREDGNTELATKFIFDFIDSLFCGGRFSACDLILQKININTLTTFNIRSIVCITYPAKDRLPSWEGFYDKVYKRTVEIASEEKAHRLLARFR